MGPAREVQGTELFNLYQDTPLHSRADERVAWFPIQPRSDPAPLGGIKIAALLNAAAAPFISVLTEMETSALRIPGGWWGEAFPCACRAQGGGDPHGWGLTAPATQQTASRSFFFFFKRGRESAEDIGAAAKRSCSSPFRGLSGPESPRGYQATPDCTLGNQ